MAEKIVISQDLQDLILSKQYEAAKDYIYKNFDSDKRPFRNIEFLDDYLSNDLKSKSSIQLKLSQISNIFWFGVMTLLTVAHLYLWISPEQTGYPWLLLFWVLGLLIFGVPILDRKVKLTIDNNRIMIQHQERFQIELNDILTGYIHEVSRRKGGIFSKPHYYLTLFEKESLAPKHFNISDTEWMEDWSIFELSNWQKLNL